MPVLEWLNKDKAVKASKEVKFRLLEEVPEFSCGENRNNVVVQGDNLEALKALLPYYKGKVKCIYIDPPYNTGNAFEHYDDNVEHSTWLSLMYPRIEMLKMFLLENGSIWVSIDSDESHYLKVIMDEIFGRDNFIDEIVWQRAYAPVNLKKTLSRSHDIILVYAKHFTQKFEFNKLQRTEAANNRYKNPDNDPRGLWKSSDMSVGPVVEDKLYKIITPSGRMVIPPAGRCWLFTEDRYKEMLADNRIWFGPSGSSVPSLKKFLCEVKQGIVAQTLWTYQEVGHNQEAKREVKKFNENDVFATPKPERLIERVLQLATNKGDIVLDSFLGSGTTAAVAHKMGRRYVGVEIGEQAVTHVVPRLQKVIEGEQGGISKSENWQGGGGFKFYRLGEALYDNNGLLNKNVKAQELGAFIFYKETQTSIDNTMSLPFLGNNDDVSYYLLFDSEKDTSLNMRTLKALNLKEGKKVIYADMCKLSKKALMDNKIEFKQIPYDVAKLGR